LFRASTDEQSAPLIPLLVDHLRYMCTSLPLLLGFLIYLLKPDAVESYACRVALLAFSTCVELACVLLSTTSARFYMCALHFLGYTALSLYSTRFPHAPLHDVL